MAAATSLNSDCPLHSELRLLPLTLCSHKALGQGRGPRPPPHGLSLHLVQNLAELLQLPGLEEDKAFQKEIGLRTLVYKAYR